MNWVNWVNYPLSKVLGTTQQLWVCCRLPPPPQRLGPLQRLRQCPWPWHLCPRPWRRCRCRCRLQRHHPLRRKENQERCWALRWPDVKLWGARCKLGQPNRIWMDFGKKNIQRVPLQWLLEKAWKYMNILYCCFAFWGCWVWEVTAWRFWCVPPFDCKQRILCLGLSCFDNLLHPLTCFAGDSQP